MALDFEQLRVKTFVHWALFLHEDQTFLGRCYVALEPERNVDPFTECTQEEWAELLTIIMPVLASTLGELFQPDLLNYANLRNFWPNCHWHVVPRYKSVRSIEGWDFVDPVPGKNWSEAKLFGKPDPFPDAILLTIRDQLIEALG